MINVQAKIKEYEALIEKAKAEKVRAETQLQALNEQAEQLRQELKAYNLTEETLPAELERLEAEITKEMLELDDWAVKIKAVLG